MRLKLYTSKRKTKKNDCQWHVPAVKSLFPSRSLLYCLFTLYYIVKTLGNCIRNCLDCIAEVTDKFTRDSQSSRNGIRNSNRNNKKNENKNQILCNLTVKVFVCVFMLLYSQGCVSNSYWRYFLFPLLRQFSSRTKDIMCHIKSFSLFLCFCNKSLYKWQEQQLFDKNSHSNTKEWNGEWILNGPLGRC